MTFITHKVSRKPSVPSGTKILVVGQGCFIVNCIVFQRFLHKGEKLECDTILLCSYFEEYLVKLLTERGCVLVFNSVVKFIGSFKVFFNVFCHEYSQKSVAAFF